MIAPGILVKLRPVASDLTEVYVTHSLADADVVGMMCKRDMVLVVSYDPHDMGWLLVIGGAFVGWVVFADLVTLDGDVLTLGGV